MTPPINVWNEVRFTDEGISISLLSEKGRGPAVVEDEMWFTYDELKAAAPSEPMSLRLSQETRESLSSDMSADQLSDNPSTDELLEYMGLQLQYGARVRDGNPPSWSEDNRLRVVGLPDKSAGEYSLEERPYREDKTVADANPSCDPSEPVVECVYQTEFTGSDAGADDSDIYAFPLSRLEVDR